LSDQRFIAREIVDISGKLNPGILHQEFFFRYCCKKSRSPAPKGYMNTAAAHIIGQFQDRISRTCRGFAADEAEARDLFQETCLHICQSIDSFRGEAQAGTWVYRITVNTCLMHQRTAQRRKESPWQQVPDREEESQIGEKILLEARLQLLQRFIRELPEKDRLLIILSLEGVSYAEMATILGLSVSNIGVRINRIKKTLTAKFEYHGRLTSDLE
jgi:RNA polymerase sigma-70 factor (ECF subfamily)